MGALNKTITFVAAAALGFGAVTLCFWGAGVDFSKTPRPGGEPTVSVPDENEGEGLQTEVESKGITIRRVNLPDDALENSSKYKSTQIFEYTIEPADASDQEIEISVTYVDGSGPATEITAEKDDTRNWIKVSCKSDFDKQIKVTLTATNEASSASASITCDYTKRINSFISNSENSIIRIKPQSFTSELDVYDVLFTENISEDISIQYSKYTIDYDYTDESKRDLYLLKMNKASLSGLNGSLSSSGQEAILNLYNKVLNMETTKFPSVQEIWTVLSNSDRAKLQNLSNLTLTASEKSSDLYLVYYLDENKAVDSSCKVTFNNAFTLRINLENIEWPDTYV